MSSTVLSTVPSSSQCLSKEIPGMQGCALIKLLRPTDGIIIALNGSEFPNILLRLFDPQRPRVSALP